MPELHARMRPPPLDPDYRAEMLGRVQRIVLEAVSNIDVEVYLFGSFARGDEKYYSDIDVALDAGERLAASTLVSLNEVLESSTIPRRVEIVDLADCSAETRERVRQEGVRWTD